MHKDYRLKRIIWAVDPFVTKPELQLQTARAIRTLTNGLDVEVEPVCVVTSHHLDIPIRSYSSGDLISGGGPSVKEMMSPQEALKAWAKVIELPKILEPKCLLLDAPSLRHSVLKLVEYAKHTHTDFIAVSTQAREGLSRFLMGSFAESLTLVSSVPLFIVNPHTEPTARYKTIVFPTSFSEQARHGFEKVLSLALKIGADVTLFHKVQYLVEDGSFQLPKPDMSPSKSDLTRWQKEAADMGVQCETVIEEKPGNIAEHIVRYANGKKSELIAMESVEGPVMTAVFGSVTRQVVRHADCPVLVFHPEKG